MKSCIQWRKNFKYLPQIDEFNIDFRNKTKELLNFLDTYAISQRVNINLTKDFTPNDIQLIIDIHQRNPNYIIAVCFEQYNVEFTKKIQDVGIPFYIKEPVYSWDILVSLIKLGVSDIFITNTLGFDLERISNITKPKGIQLRCYANYCQLDWYNEEVSDTFKGFYIRPNDVDIYSQYIDVIEFYNSVDIQQTLYEVYFKDKEWDGPLKEIIKGLNRQVYNYYILGPDFAKYRAVCRKKCLANERCHLCEKTYELAISLEKSNQFEVFKKIKGRKTKT